MDCPQCGGTLATYALSGREASVCEDCGYVGIPAEHRGDPRRIESWDEALRRFYRAHGADAEPGVQVRPPLSRPSEGSVGESWDEALRRFYERRTDGTADEDEDDDASDEPTEDETADEGDTRAPETSAGETEEADTSEAEAETTRTSQSSAGDS